MLFDTPQNFSKYQNISLIYDGETIERVGNFKYLGIAFDSHMTWSHHIDLIASNVSKRCGVFVMLSIICQIISSKNLLILLLCHILIIVVVFGPTAYLLCTNETGPLPLCTFSVMGLSICSSIFSESSPVRSKLGIINELSGFQNSVPTVRCSYTSSSWHGHTGHAYCICFVGKH